MKITGGLLALLLACGSPAQAGLPDAAWSAAFPIPLPGLPGVRPPVPAVPPFAALPPIPVVVFKGLSLKGVQFSRADRIPASLVAAMDRTQATLRVALYELDLPDVADAILRAKARGVDVQLVYDESHAKTPSPEFQRLLDGGVAVRILKGGGSFGIMHNKFAVFDGELLETGSFNWSVAADQKNFENAMFRSDASLAAGYTRYWDWMWSLAHAPAASIAAAGPIGAGLGAPPADATRPISFNGGSWPRYAFSPQGGLEDYLVDALGRARSTVDMAIFSLYSQRVADALIAAKARGVVVRVVADMSQSHRAQPVASLAAAGVSLRLSAGRGGAGVLHHKYTVVDGAWLMLGSYNYSQNAELYNFENDLFTTSFGEVAAYGGEFAAVWDQAHAPAAGELPAPKSL
jgi:phosphatidylserine/phosphatidylglycerophosphate/cardiolipin synthase-like enzyme